MKPNFCSARTPRADTAWALPYASSPANLSSGNFSSQRGSRCWKETETSKNFKKKTRVSKEIYVFRKSGWDIIRRRSLSCHRSYQISFRSITTTGAGGAGEEASINGQRYKKVGGKWKMRRREYTEKKLTEVVIYNS
ncbi:Hypothetical protein NTJ_03523 [Nesidiocoris tenuis]|uniref:Uncharacterized protein n=1 Tax=Nesidiocoris tenuis TaxID=355587 RepID=A0ABN7AEK7_9HEMI|nr:Hypothetical protein NTJ_03523 [Nesidiocoris tenuis]